MSNIRETITEISDAELRLERALERAAKGKGVVDARGKLLAAIATASYTGWRSTVTDIAVAGDKPIPNLGHRTKSLDEALAALVKLPEAERFLGFLACHKIDDKAMSRVCGLLAILGHSGWVRIDLAAKMRRNGLPGFNPCVEAVGLGRFFLADFAGCLTPEAAVERLARIRDGTWNRNANHELIVTRGGALKRRAVTRVPFPVA